MTTTAQAHAPWNHEVGELKAPKVHYIGFLRRQTNAIRAEKCLSKLSFPYAYSWQVPLEMRDTVIEKWKDKLAKARSMKSKCWGGLPGWWVDQAMLIHSCEGAWNDPGGPYYGGMQMDISFQQTYGPEFYRRWGTADNWPVWAQLTASYRGWKARGWQPWPACAAHFGLL